MSNQPKPTFSAEAVEAARQQMQTISERVKSDAQFAERLKNDPIGVMQAEGLPAPAIGDALTYWKVQPEVEGQVMESYTNCGYDTSMNNCCMTLMDVSDCGYLTCLLFSA